MLSASSSYTGILEYTSTSFFSNSSSTEIFLSIRNTFVLGIIISRATFSSNSIIFSIISFSTSLIIPCSLPTSTSERSSSFETFSSMSSSFIFNAVNIIFVENVRNLTKGENIFETVTIVPTDESAIFSDDFRAILFGMSSPKTNVIYDNTKVIKIIEICPL